MSSVRFDITLQKNKENYLKLVQHLKQAMSHEALLQVDPYSEKENFKQFQNRVVVAQDEMLGWFDKLQRSNYELTLEEENEAAAIAKQIKNAKNRLSEPKLFFIDKLSSKNNPGYYVTYERHDDSLNFYNQFKLVQCYPLLNGNVIPVQQIKKTNPKAEELVGRFNLAVIKDLLKLIDSQEKSIKLTGKLDSSKLVKPSYDQSVFNDPELASFHVELFQGFIDYINGLSRQLHTLSQSDSVFTLADINEIKASLEEIKARKVSLFKKLGLDKAGISEHKAELAEGFEEGEEFLKDCNELIAKIEKNINPKPIEKVAEKPVLQKVISTDEDFFSAESDDEFQSVEESDDSYFSDLSNDESVEVLLVSKPASTGILLNQLSVSESSPVIELTEKLKVGLEERVEPSSPVRSRSHSDVLGELYIKKEEPRTGVLDFMRKHRNVFITLGIAIAATAVVAITGFFFAPALLALPFVAKASFSVFATTGFMVSGKIIVGSLIAAASLVAGGIGAGLARVGIALASRFGGAPSSDAEPAPAISPRRVDAEPRVDSVTVPEGKLLDYVTDPSKALHRSRQDLLAPVSEHKKDNKNTPLPVIGR